MPPHRIGTLPQEVPQLQGLLHLLEEHLDGPPAPVQFRHRVRAPLQIVGEEGHFNLPAVQFHQRHHPAQDFRILPTSLLGLQLDQVVAQDVSLASPLLALHHPELHVVLGSRHPRDPALEQVEEVSEVHVGLVEQDDFPVFHAGADLTGTLVVVVLGGVDDGKARQETLEIQPEVTLGSRLAPTVLGPVHAGGHQLDGGGVDDVDDAVESTQDAPS